ncbi:MAG: VanW family protein [Actinobacteria bacterium]|nr:VanW family protein [Actinomycetota bacterium]
MTKTRIAIIAGLAVAGLLVIVTSIVLIDRAAKGGEILGTMRVEGIDDLDLGGLGEEDAAARLTTLEDRLASTPIEVTAAGQSFTLVPRDVGYRIDTAAMLDEAFGPGRSGNWLGQFGWWFGNLFGGTTHTLPLPATYDADAVAALVEEWEVEGIADPPYVGDVAMEDFFVTWEYPRAGTGIDREAAARLLDAALLDPARPAVDLPTRYLQPALTEADIDAAVATAEGLLSGPVTLVNSQLGESIEIPRHVLAEALAITRDDTTEVPTFSFDWLDGPLQDYVQPRMAARATEAVDARIVINADDTVTLVPSVPAQAPDMDALVGEVQGAVASVTRVGTLAFAELYEAEFSTADAEALGIRYKLSEFTTYHNCCENRVINIHTIADATDGALVMPGETFSLNEHVGQRTIAKGYVRAGAIISGYVQCCDSDINIGGGTSQFTTTLYNAIFYSGMEDVYHFPHTIYFTRYPEGIEATLGYPEPDLKFRNNTPNAVLIKTEYTDTSITVKFFGDNGGIEVEAERSGRFGYTAPITRYEPVDDPDLCGGKNGTTREKEKGSGGWSLRVYRHITYPEGHWDYPDGGESTEEWYVHYDGSFKVIEYDTDDCPEPPPPDTP